MASVQVEGLDQHEEEETLVVVPTLFLLLSRTLAPLFHPCGGGGAPYDDVAVGVGLAWPFGALVVSALDSLATPNDLPEVLELLLRGTPAQTVSRTAAAGVAGEVGSGLHATFSYRCFCCPLSRPLLGLLPVPMRHGPSGCDYTGTSGL